MAVTRWFIDLSQKEFVSTLPMLHGTLRLVYSGVVCLNLITLLESIVYTITQLFAGFEVWYVL